MSLELSYKPVNFNILNLNYQTTNDTVLVLMSTFNRIEPIIDSINSIINQDYGDVLLHIMDDNSTDDVLGIIKTYIIENNINNIILSKNNINSGPYINFNHILKYHNKDQFGYWILQGSDDISDKKRISYLVDFLQKNQFISSCRSKYTRDKEQTTPKYGDSMIMCKKSVLTGIGYYDNNRFGGDSDYANRINLKYGKIGEVPHSLYYANSGDDRLTKIYGNDRRKKYVNKINEEYKKSFYRNATDVVRDSIVCGMATIESRKESLKETVSSIINQVDKLIIYQNGYYEIFDFLKNPKIEVISSLHTGVDMGDAGKFYKLNEYDNCYYFSVDDDLIYPEKYFSETLRRCNEFENKKVITYHGRSFKNFPIKSYYKDSSERYACLYDVDRDVNVQFGGTGVMCIHTSILKIPFSYFKNPNMADIWIGKYCIENNIEIICLKHKKGYLKYIPQKSTIYDVESKSDQIQTNVVNSIVWVKNVGDIKIINDIKTIEPKIEIIPQKEIELTKKEINYDKINSIFSNNNPKIITKPQIPQNNGNLKLNSETFSKIQRTKKRLR